MQKVSKYIYLLFKNVFIISTVSLLVTLLGGENSSFEIVFGTIGYYGILICLFLIAIHVVVLFLSFIVRNIQYIYLLLKYTVIISIISLLIAWLGGENNSFGIVFGSIALYGTMISVFLFFAHMIALILSFILKNNSKIKH
jgi:hypothetical protein